MEEIKVYDGTNQENIGAPEEKFLPGVGVACVGFGIGCVGGGFGCVGGGGGICGVFCP